VTNPYEIQYRMVKAVKIADKAEELHYTVEEFEAERNLESWARVAGVNKPSRETWEMALSLLRHRLEYDGPGGLDSPRFIQHLGSMAVQIADTLAKHDVDSGEADLLSKPEKRTVERLSGAEKDSFDIGKAFLEARERFRWAKK
jgi:hypothetical protein